MEIIMNTSKFLKLSVLVLLACLTIPAYATGNSNSNNGTVYR